MPLRDAIYYGRTMEKLVESRALYRTGRIQIPTPPITAIQPANAAAIIIMPLPMEITSDSFGRSMAVKYPDPTMLNPSARNDRLNILNTDAE